jgi:iron complex transport system substrate-binding protein
MEQVLILKKYYCISFVMMRLFYLVPLLFCVVSSSCKSPGSPADSNNTNKGNYKIKYAKGFNISVQHDCIKISVHNPWQGAQGVSYTYLLSDKPVLTSEKGVVAIKTPVERVVCMSSTQVAMIDFVEKTSSIVAVSGPDYISNLEVRKGIDAGKIADVGYEQSMNYELLLALKPDVIFVYGVGSEMANQYNKLAELGLKVVYVGEYLEKTALARAEWVKFTAAFFNQLPLAETRFDSIDNEYKQYKKQVENVTSRPRVLCDLPWRNTWYMPGGSSYLASLISDAGGTYLWNDDTHIESIPVNFELVAERAPGADVWINVGTAKSINDILSAEPRLALFRVLQQKQIFNNNRITNKGGGSDYWESGLVNPQIVLKDLISIFHPEIFPNYQAVYYRKLN